MLAIAGLNLTYARSIRALRGVTLNVGRGEVVALLGANGAGKSSLLRAVSGLLPQHGGSMTADSATLEGNVLTGRDPVRAVGLGIRQVMEGRRIFVNLTVRENLLTGAATLRSKRARNDAVAAMMDRFPLLRARAQEQAGLLSGGQQQIVAIARALVGSPRLLMLDEPSLGLSPQATHEVAALLTELHREGLSMLLVEQNVSLALSLADFGYVLSRGEVVRAGTKKQLMDDSQLSELYLGSSPGENRALGTATAQAVEGSDLPWYR
ncbi:ABC transporter ATP-binding protein [Pseudonocardia sp. GCM10023141]|uniref:ABC transporter ATP-binding protein n=1 Tax=Pseudonocardia sp. GCM10023141 TaxID=3252653 RepID=UPI00361CE12C